MICGGVNYMPAEGNGRARSALAPLEKQLDKAGQALLPGKSVCHSSGPAKLIEIVEVPP